MTPYCEVYDAFTAKILEDEWYCWDFESVEKDMRAILEGAIPYFKFPRIPLDRDENGFTNTLTSQEIQMLASLMRVEWLNRTILSYKNLKPLYSESDFSQANLIDKLSDLLEMERKNVRRLESTYYRSINGRPFHYGSLSGGK